MLLWPGLEVTDTGSHFSAGGKRKGVEGRESSEVGTRPRPAQCSCMGHAHTCVPCTRGGKRRNARVRA